jgi:maleate isomerase
VIGYGCTSASTVIGPDGVRDAIRESLPGVQVTEPLSALLAGCRALGLKRLGFVTPYVPCVSARMQEKLEQAGHQIVSFGSFEEGDDRVVARISESSIYQSILNVAGQSKCDGVIVACTNLRVAHVAAKAEAALGIPVLSSNLALAWHMLSLAGITPNKPVFGRLHSGVHLR